MPVREQINIDSVDLLGVDVAVTSPKLTCDFMDRQIRDKVRGYLCFAPVSTLVDCQKSEDYRKVINGSILTNPDGVPLVWLARLRGKKQMQRTCGPDTMLKSCELGQQAGHSHFFYGGTEENNAKMIANLKDKFPHIKIAGQIAPPFKSVGEIEDQSTLDAINQAKPDILWIGLGSPKQDYWMANHRDRLDVPVICGVGAAFDFFSGVKAHAPKWMQRSGLEWLFRLCCEPRRLWKRYIIGNTQFIYYLITKELFKDG